MIDFLTNCGNKNLQYLLVPARLDSALAQMDTDRDGEFSLAEWEDAIETALSNKLAQRAAAREAQRRVASVDAKLRLVEGAKADETSLGAKADAAALFERMDARFAAGFLPSTL